MSTLQISLHWSKKNGDWRNYPRLILALKQERERLKAAGLNPNYQISRSSSLYGGEKEEKKLIKVEQYVHRDKEDKAIPGMDAVTQHRLTAPAQPQSAAGKPNGN